MPLLGVNIDHVATIRQARMTDEPDPVWAASLCELAGCDSIVVHLREDRRHIQARDVALLKETVSTRLNLEMSIAPSIVKAALKYKPSQSTLVPEKRHELTTEGGLNVVANYNKIKRVVEKLKKAGIVVSLFIDPEIAQIEKSKQLGADSVEFHTGNYANSKNELQAKRFLEKLKSAVKYARSLEITVNAGHGLTYRNVAPVAEIDGIHELNIGHSIISRAVFVGLECAVREMKELIR